MALPLHSTYVNHCSEVPTYVTKFLTSQFYRLLTINLVGVHEPTKSTKFILLLLTVLMSSPTVWNNIQKTPPWPRYPHWWKKKSTVFGVPIDVGSPRGHWTRSSCLINISKCMPLQIWKVANCTCPRTCNLSLLCFLPSPLRPGFRTIFHMTCIYSVLCGIHIII